MQLYWEHSKKLVKNFIGIRIRLKNTKDILTFRDSRIKDILTFNDDMTINSYEKGIPKTNIGYDCFSLIILNSIIRADGTYHSQVYLEVCGYRIKD